VRTSVETVLDATNPCAPDAAVWIARWKKAPPSYVFDEFSFAVCSCVCRILRLFFRLWKRMTRLSSLLTWQALLLLMVSCRRWASNLVLCIGGLSFFSLWLHCTLTLLLLPSTSRLATLKIPVQSSLRAYSETIATWSRSTLATTAFLTRAPECFAMPCSSSRASRFWVGGVLLRIGPIVCRYVV